MGAMLSQNAFPVAGRVLSCHCSVIGPMLTTQRTDRLDPRRFTRHGPERGAGRGRQLAEKGANIVIVALDVRKLQEGISERTFRYLSHVVPARLITIWSDSLAERSQLSSNATLPLHQRRPHRRVRIRPGHCRNDDLERRIPAGRRLVLRGQRPLDAFHRHAARTVSAHDGQQLFHERLHGPCRIERMVATNYQHRPSVVRFPETCSSINDARPAISQQPPLPRHLISTAPFVFFHTFAGLAPYSPAKDALRLLSDSLSKEMNFYAAAHPSVPRVQLHTVFPATIFTESLDAENRVKADVTRMLEKGDKGQTADQVTERSIRGLEKGEDLVTTTLLTRLVMAASLGGSLRGEFVNGCVDMLLSWVVVVVMVFVRWDVDRKVSNWENKYGASGVERE